MNADQMFDYIIENDIATSEELKLVTSINGYNEQTLTDVIEVRTGYDFEQHKEFEV
tara:strand:- start:323 stop:490 length:168 start_codon:yes stop_codon:yes gene_type:complete